MILTLTSAARRGRPSAAAVRRTITPCTGHSHAPRMNLTLWASTTPSRAAPSVSARPYPRRFAATDYTPFSTLQNRSHQPPPHETVTRQHIRFFSNVRYEPPADNKSDGEEKKPGKWQQLKTAFKEYRYVFLAYYGTAFLTPIPFLWAGLEIGGLDGVGLLQWLGVDQIYEGVNNWNNSFINLLVALEMNEILEFVRLPLILSTTPKVAQWWRSRGSSSQDE